MDTSILHLEDVKIGQVFTPVMWAEWLIKRWRIFDAWLDGATICDPTAGQGAFALAMFRLARARNVRITPDLLSRLVLLELCQPNLHIFRIKAKQEYEIDFPSSKLIALDVITDHHNTKYDILIGNPPWANFTDLPSSYKERLKPYFVAEGLVPDKKLALLGSSRTDIAALVLKVVLGKLLRKDGIGCFYLPLSLFSGDGAHVGFRDYVANHRKFAVDEVYEFTSTKVFDGVGTSYCCAKIKIDVQQRFPVRYYRENGDGWIEHTAVPLNKPSDQWRIIQDGDEAHFKSSINVKLSPEQKPRQGVNTCGANSLFIFEDKPTFLPEEFMFPLATKEIWREEQDVAPSKWILLPYDRITGKPLKWPDIEQYEGMQKYLTDAKSKLQARKGTLIRSAIQKGVWWSLLGVGSYSFAPYKVIWEAYGKSNFRPVIIHKVQGQVWQANQAMHAFIPCWDKANAKRILSALQHPGILTLLKQLNGTGKCNWAQPGKIKKIISFDKPQYHQPLLIE